MPVFFRPHDTGTKHFFTMMKPFCPSDAKVLKPSPGSDRCNDAPNGRDRRSNRGRPMFNPDALKLNWRKINFRPVGLGVLAIGAMALSGAASAAPMELFPFLMTPAPQSAPPVQ